ILLLFHTMFMILIYFFVLRFLFQNSLYTFIILLFHSMFCIVYYFLLWKDLYIQDYHFLLHKYTLQKIIKNLCISIFIIYFAAFISSGLFLFFNSTTGSKIPFFQISILVLIDTGFFILLHIFQYIWIRLLTKQGFLKKNIMIAGNPDKRLPILNFIVKMKESKELTGKITTDGKTWYMENQKGETHEHNFKELQEIIASNIIGEMIFFVGDELCGKKLYELVSYCRENSINYYIIPQITQLPEKGFWNKLCMNIPFIDQWKSKRDSLTFITCKRLIDLIIAFTAIILFMPLYLIIACVIKLNDGGPVFHISERVGKNGKIIKFIKFRSMVLNAEKLKKDILHLNQRKDGPLFKLDDDPRTTKIGRILRKFSLDEIPQFFNVLKGDLSLIGPRPHLVEEVREYEKNDNLRLECVPGIIGLPQMYGNDFTGFREIVDLDLHYRKNWSIFLDLKILFLGCKFVLLPFLPRE
ncbi:MAG: sugar transferase, partial [Spirochaetales bacterium]|nr:sugar transferase [Spirochaetales bacterium]